MVTETNIDSLRVLGTFARFLRVIENDLGRRLDNDLDLTELAVMISIERKIDTPSAIARTIQLDPARLTRVADHLVSRGYVTRGIDPGDRRRCPLSLTDTGMAALHEGTSTLTGIMSDLLDRLGENDRVGLIQALERLRDVLDALPAKA